MRGTVLVVDDDPMVRRSTSRLLKIYGWNVLEACDPVEAMGLVAEYDVIVSDWDMPYGGGARVIDEALVPVVVVSGNHEVEGQVETFLLKPVSGPVLDQKLQGLMKK